MQTLATGVRPRLSSAVAEFARIRAARKPIAEDRVPAYPMPAYLLHASTNAMKRSQVTSSS